MMDVGERSRMDARKRQMWTAEKNLHIAVPRSTVSGYIQKGFFYRAILKGVSFDIDDNGFRLEPSRRALATRIQTSNLPALLLPAEKEEFIVVRIAQVENASRYFVQLEENGAMIVDMMTHISYLEGRKAFGRISNAESGTIVLARFAEDGRLYRASIVSKISMLKVKVFFVDYGNLAEVPVSDVYRLEDQMLLEAPPQAICVQIQDIGTSVLSRRRFTEAVIDRTVGIQLLSVASNNEAFIVKMHVISEGKEIDIADILSGKYPPHVSEASKPEPKPQPTKWPSKNDMRNGSGDDRRSSRSGVGFNRGRNISEESSGSAQRGGESANYGGSWMRSTEDRRDGENREDGQSLSNWDRNAGGGFGLRGNAGFAKFGRSSCSDDGADVDRRFGGSFGRRGENGPGRRTFGGDSERFDGERGRLFGDSRSDEESHGRGPNRDRECFNCHEFGHLSRDCPERKADKREGGGRFSGECYKCYAVGHIARDCPQPVRERRYDDGGQFGDRKFGSGRLEDSGRRFGWSGFNAMKREEVRGFGGKRTDSESKNLGREFGSTGFQSATNEGHRSFGGDNRGDEDEREGFGGERRFNATKKPQQRTNAYNFGFSWERGGSEVGTDGRIGRFGSKDSDVGSTSFGKTIAENMVYADATTSASEDLMMQQAEEWGLNDYKQPKSVQPKNSDEMLRQENEKKSFKEVNNDEADRGCQKGNDSSKDGGKFQKAGDFERHYTSAARGEASSGENFESSDGTRIAQERKIADGDNSLLQERMPVQNNNIVQRIDPPVLAPIEMGEVVRSVRSDGSVDASPDSFCIQLCRDEETIGEVSLFEMPAKSKKIDSPQLRMVCMAPFCGLFYRAEIVSIVSSERCCVMFVDYGNKEEVSTDEIYFIDDTLPAIMRSSPRLAFQCRLSDAMPIDGEKTFSAEACKLFSLLAQGILDVCFVCKSVSGVYEVTLGLPDGRSVSDILCKRGYAARLNWSRKSVPIFDECLVMRSDDTDDVEEIFTMQFVDDFQNIEKLSTAYAPCTSTLHSPRIGDITIASFDDLPYRAEVVDIVEERSSEGGGTVKQMYRVRYVDFGNECLKAAEELFAVDRDEQPEMVLHLPKQGIRCRLIGVQPCGDGKDETTRSWSSAALEVLNAALPPGEEVTVVFGHPCEDVYPIRVVTTVKESAEVAANKVDEEAEGVGGVERIETERKVDLAKLLLEKGLAELAVQPTDFPTADLSFIDKGKADVRIVGTDGTAIYVRPTAFDDLYEALGMALAEVVVSPAELGAMTGLVRYNGGYKRARVLVQKVKAVERVSDGDEDNDEFEERRGESMSSSYKVVKLETVTIRKYFLVDEGKLLEEEEALKEIGQLQAVNISGNNCDFMVWACHKLAIPIHLNGIELTEALDAGALGGGFDGVISAHIHPMPREGELLVDELTLADGRSFASYLLECGVAKKVEKHVLEENEHVWNERELLNSDVTTSFGVVSCEDDRSTIRESTSPVSSGRSLGIAFASPSQRRRSPSLDLHVRHTSPIKRRRRVSDSSSDESSTMTDEERMTNRSDMESQEKLTDVDEVEKGLQRIESAANDADLEQVDMKRVTPVLAFENKEGPTSSEVIAQLPEPPNDPGAREVETLGRNKACSTPSPLHEMFVVEASIQIHRETDFVDDSKSEKESFSKYRMKSKSLFGRSNARTVELRRGPDALGRPAEQTGRPGRERPDQKSHMTATEMISVVESGVFDEDLPAEHTSSAVLVADALLKEHSSPRINAFGESTEEQFSESAPENRFYDFESGTL
uniref:Tudor domain-containing protein n=1 Tax=Parascaris univalens TaxID=6257 RepID=A0A915AN51_PARUN